MAELSRDGGHPAVIESRPAGSDDGCPLDVRGIGCWSRVSLGRRPVMPIRADNEDVAERAQRDTRLSIRTSSQQQLIRRAATALDKSVTDFVLDSAASAAERVLADRRWFLLSEEEWERFQALMDAPVAAMPRLGRALTAPTVFDQKDA